MLPSRHLLIRREKRDTLSLRFLLRLTDSTPTSSSSVLLHGRFSRITPLPRPSPFPLLSIPWVLSPLLLRLSDSLKSTILDLSIAGSVPPTLLSPDPSAAPPPPPPSLSLCVCVYLLNCTLPRNPALTYSSFYATRMDPPYGGSVIATVTTSSDKTRKRRHAVSTFSLTAYRLPSGFLFVSIVTWPILPHHPTPTPLPVPSSFYTPDLVPYTVTSFQLSQIYYF